MRGKHYGYDHELDIDRVDWGDKKSYSDFLVRIFSRDVTKLNDDLTKNPEIYFCISEQEKNEWYKHFNYISGGREGIKISYLDLDTGETGHSDGYENL